MIVFRSVVSQGPDWTEVRYMDEFVLARCSCESGLVLGTVRPDEDF